MTKQPNIPDDQAVDITAATQEAAESGVLVAADDAVEVSSATVADYRGDSREASEESAEEATETAGANDEVSAQISGKNSKKTKKAKGKRKGPRVGTVIAVVILLCGVGLLAYPTFSDWWNSYHQTRAIVSYVNAVQETDPKTIERMFAQARAYNDRLFANPNRWHMSDAEKAKYESLLDPAGNGVMGYVQCNAINLEYPIYHGMDETVLQIAIGHLEGTSLPIGGPGTHSAISGHRGLPSARLFTDLDRLVEGDTFTITVLDQTCTYEVDQIRIVLPEDLSNLNMESGKDYATLITCTPYGINTHRMLVRGHRIDNILDADTITAEAIQIPRYIAIPAVGVPMLFIFLVSMLVYYRVRRTPNKEVAAETLRERVRDMGEST